MVWSTANHCVGGVDQPSVSKNALCVLSYLPHPYSEARSFYKRGNPGSRRREHDSGLQMSFLHFWWVFFGMFTPIVDSRCGTDWNSNAHYFQVLNVPNLLLQQSCCGFQRRNVSRQHAIGVKVTWPPAAGKAKTLGTFTRVTGARLVQKQFKLNTFCWMH